MSSPLAVISGAGIAGLAAAWWLHCAGWRTVVVERAPHLRDSGHMMGLSGPGLATVRKMGLVPRLQTVAYPDRGPHIYRSRNDRDILRVDYRNLLTGIEWITLRRTELVRILHEETAGCTDLRLNTTITAFDNRDTGIGVQLSDGSQLDADLLIGADGVHSTLRRQVFVPDAACLRPLGYRYAAYDVPDAGSLGEGFISYPEPGIQSEYYGLTQGRLAALHVWRSQVDGFVPPTERRALLQSLSTRSHPFVRATLAALEPDAELVIDDLAMVELPSWRSQRVVMLGDAAHSLSLISGQGAGMALASASVLANELERAAGHGQTPNATQLDAALSTHDARLRPSVLKLQQRSRKLAPAFVPATAWAFHLRNLALRAMPGVMIKRFFLSGLKSEAEAMAALR
ncbi:2-polyprenyl-6-methoxyphenol hydroxylase [Pigmentiphaga aceris]|uniref:2-polyprenyl-6-methoxyphenol hydroxylase n=1 Tax=Pigmentiphaga aceris TaxID=1940612 RepID=A0A5C0AWB2_9BURK|nr:FAD-dependent monooxygenase [Pigmentiphaga aceris]QEI04991.1 2-polyprenyl-6-methoxyphenol hydroxylase [Pigmentiphaga aceris]